MPVFGGTAAGHPGNCSTEGGFEQARLSSHCIALQNHILSLFFIAFFYLRVKSYHVYLYYSQVICDNIKWIRSISKANKLVLVSVHVFQLYIICWR